MSLTHCLRKHGNSLTQIRLTYLIVVYIYLESSLSPPSSANHKVLSTSATFPSPLVCLAVPNRLDTADNIYLIERS